MIGGLRIWIQGAGELASGAAAALLAKGHRVVMAEMANPLAVRRLVCFSEAVYEGEARVAGWHGRRVTAAELDFIPGEVLVAVDPEGARLPILRPDIVVDARMTKRTPQELRGADCPLIGLGPGFICGRDADLIVETIRGPELGRVIAQGGAQPYTGRPGLVGGATVTRLLRAPTAGRLVPRRAIGDLVRAGDVVGHIAGEAVQSRSDGMLRGLVHQRAELVAGEKVGDIDPRGSLVDPSLLTDKAIGVGQGVLAAVERLARGFGTELG